MDSKGISPLFATILLIILSIGMGVAVMSWGEEYIEARAEFVQGVQETVTSCDLISFSIINVGGIPQLCQEATTLRGLIDNGPDVEINDFHARVVADGQIFVQESTLDDFLPRGSATPIAFSMGEIGDVNQLKLTPKILVGGQPILCTKQAKIVENIQAC